MPRLLALAVAESDGLRAAWSGQHLLLWAVERDAKINGAYRVILEQRGGGECRVPLGGDVTGRTVRLASPQPGRLGAVEVGLCSFAEEAGFAARVVLPPR